MNAAPLPAPYALWFSSHNPGCLCLVQRFSIQAGRCEKEAFIFSFTRLEGDDQPVLSERQLVGFSRHFSAHVP